MHWSEGSFLSVSEHNGIGEIVCSRLTKGDLGVSVLTSLQTYARCFGVYTIYMIYRAVMGLTDMVHFFAVVVGLSATLS